ncbi:MAG: lysophospholipid acyltransferase family protein [Alistipes sp.]|nr:lysophospholipid acyltransferase family protein [Alistipes sp.]
MRRNAHVKLNPWQKILYGMMFALCKAVAVLPYFVRYRILGNALYFLFHHCLHYRRRVIMENLRTSFPERSEEELREICRRFYLTLADIIIDTLSMAAMSDEECRRHIIFENGEQVAEATRGRGFVGLLAHFGCWEYCQFWGLAFPWQTSISVYHPLENPVFEKLFRRLRRRTGAVTIPKEELMRFYLHHRYTGYEGTDMALGLIADQSPHVYAGSHWFRFLNHDTVFYEGGAKIAVKCNVPVYFLCLERVRRGYYTTRCEMLYDGQEPITEVEITERYVRRLEQMIRRTPELWLWSHRRWKHRKPSERETYGTAE